jgi:ankyrin repeat protein
MSLLILFSLLSHLKSVPYFQRIHIKTGMPPQYDPTLIEYAHALSIFDETHEPRLWLAAMMGLTDMVRSCLEEGDAVDCLGVCIDPEHPVPEDELEFSTPLQQVCMGSRFPEIVKLLLEYGASVTFTGDKQSTPLSLAAYEGCVDTVRLLLLHKADVHAIVPDIGDLTPLEGCVMSDHACPLVVAVLIEHGANVYTTWPDVLVRLHANTKIEEDVKADIEAVVKAEMVTRDKCVALAMAHQDRLGVDSMAKALPPDVLRDILLMV